MAYCPARHKKSFRNYAEAEAYTKSHRNARALRPYWCKCGKVHLTSQPGDFDVARVSVYRGRRGRKKW